MGPVVTIGLDLAKSAFQVRGVDAKGGVVFRLKLTRAPVEAYGVSSTPSACLHTDSRKDRTGPSPRRPGRRPAAAEPCSRRDKSGRGSLERGAIQ